MCLQPVAELQSTLQPVPMDPVIEKKYKENFHALVSQSIITVANECFFHVQKQTNALCVCSYAGIWNLSRHCGQDDFNAATDVIAI